MSEWAMGNGQTNGRVAGQRLTSPGRASAPQWPMPGTSWVYALVIGSNVRCGPVKQSALFDEPCEHDRTRLREL